MSKEIAKISGKNGREVTIKQHDGDDFTKIVTLGFAGNDSYSVQVNGKTVSSASTKNEAIQKAADLAKK